MQILKITTLASGSKGNCYILEGDSDKLLLECGISIKEIKKGINFDFTDVVGCLVTHEHKDHSKAILDIAKCGVNIYTSEGTKGELEHHNITTVQAKQQFIIGEFIILPFDTEHDAIEPLGFLIVSKITKERLLFITDTYYCRYKFKYLDYIMIECNYQSEILEENFEEGKIQLNQYNRLLESHMSFRTCKDYLSSLDLSVCKEIYLMHCSSRHSDTEKFKREIQELTGIKTIVAEGV